MKLLALVFLFVAVYAKHEHYVGYKSYYVGPQNQVELIALGQLLQNFELEVLGYPSVNRKGLVLVKPELQAIFTQTLDNIGVSYRVQVKDVVKALQNDNKASKEFQYENQARNEGAGIPFNNYQPLSVYDVYLEDIAHRYPNVAKLVTPANSWQGRPIKYLKISTTNFEDKSKPIIFIEGGMHAREWISPPTVAWAINKLVENVTDPDLLEKFDWILFPISNPDGYEHSYTSHRFWRKTLSTIRSPISRLCPGVDINRNFDFVWNTVGVTNHRCADNYPGRSAFSEIETRVIRDILHENLSRMALYISMHSFGSLILYPWGHNGTLSNNAFALHAVGAAMADTINANRLPHFPSYEVGNSVNVIGYVTSGTSEDYAHSIGVPFSYTIELPGILEGYDGFDLDPRYIETVCRETWEGIVAGVRKVGTFFVPRG